jgi:hypothetical protein
MYPMPNATDVVSFLTYGNTVTNNWFWTFCLIAIYGIMFGNLKINNSFEDSFGATSFFCGIIGIFMGVLSFVSGFVTLISILLSIVGAMVLLLRKTPTT